MAVCIGKDDARRGGVVAGVPHYKPLLTGRLIGRTLWIVGASRQTFVSEAST
jgi:hypothetical protein